MHGGVFIVIKNTINAEVVSHEQTECCVTCKVVVYGDPIYICCFYNPPKGSNYRYELPGFKRIVKSLTNKASKIILGHLHFPNANWSNLTGDDDQKQEILDLMNSNFYGKQLTSRREEASYSI